MGELDGWAEGKAAEKLRRLGRSDDECTRDWGERQTVKAKGQERKSERRESEGRRELARRATIAVRSGRAPEGSGRCWPMPSGRVAG